MHYESSVYYTFKRQEAKELGLTPFRYKYIYKGQLEDGGEVVYCRNARDFNVLLEFWSRSKEWTYIEANDHYMYYI
jgi:hypothetical protein